MDPTPTDASTPDDEGGPLTGNDGSRHLLRTANLVWDEETIRRSAGLGRSKAVSRWQLEDNEETVHLNETMGQP